VSHSASMAALALSSCGLRASFLPPALFSMILPPLLNVFKAVHWLFLTRTVNSRLPYVRSATVDI
jgi:hypothetical protein